MVKESLLSDKTVQLDSQELNPHSLEKITVLDIQANDIKNIIWCTGFRPDYTWLTLDIFKEDGSVNLLDGVRTKGRVYFCGMGLQPDPDTKSSFGVGLFALVESAKRAVTVMHDDMIKG